MTSLLRLRQVMARVGHGRTWIYAEIAAGRLPAPLRIGGVSVWVSTEIDDWIAQQIATAPRGLGAPVVRQSDPERRSGRPGPVRMPRVEARSDDQSTPVQ